MRIANAKLIVLAACAAALAAGCSTTRDANGSTVVTPSPWRMLPQIDTSQLLPAAIPAVGALIPDTNVKISPSVSMPLEKMVFWGAYAGAAYLILDPLAPNWSVEQASFPDDHVHMVLEMKRYYAGGAGEARQVFHRRAKELMRAGGFDSYQVVEYNESLESSVLGSKRTAFGVIRLTGKLPG